jgi:hypothetical protein
MLTNTFLKLIIVLSLIHALYSPLWHAQNLLISLGLHLGAAWEWLPVLYIPLLRCSVAPALAGRRLSLISSELDWSVSLRTNCWFHFPIHSLGSNSDGKLGLCTVLCRRHWQLKAKLIVLDCSPIECGKDTVTSVALYAKLLPKKETVSCASWWVLVSRSACTAPDNSSLFCTMYLPWPTSVGVITAPIFLRKQCTIANMSVGLPSIWILALAFPWFISSISTTKALCKVHINIFYISNSCLIISLLLPDFHQN